MNDPRNAAAAATLRALDREGLYATLRNGHAIDPRALDDTEYRGVSLGLPAWVEALSWKTFVKVFHRDPRTGHLRGWNAKLEQTGLEGPPSFLVDRDGQPKTFGHYLVRPGDVAAPPPVAAGCERGLLLDYTRGGNPALDPTARLRDPLVALREGDVSLLFGWSYVLLPWGATAATPSFFYLERVGPLGHHATPPNPQGDP